MIEHINIIDAFHSQIEALLDLMQCADSDCTDVKSVNVAAEMCQTMLDELMSEVNKMYEEAMNMEKRINNARTNSNV